MDRFQSYSPIQFEGQPAETENYNGWEVVVRYDGEKTEPLLADLSHRDKWDVQDSQLARIRPVGLEIPETPGQCRFHNGVLVMRLNATRAAVWHLVGSPPDVPRAFPYTDVTDGYALMALMGEPVFEIMEKLTPLPLSAASAERPWLFQGPVADVPCQVAVVGGRPDAPVVLIACARGYGQSLAGALLEAGQEWGLTPAGERAFSERMG